MRCARGDDDDDDDDDDSSTCAYYRPEPAQQRRAPAPIHPFLCPLPSPPPLPAAPRLSNLCAIHAKRVTIMVKDIWLARRIRGLHDFGGWVM